jgi:glycosyltransferase involved in cell wall biosynthesis
MLTDFRYPGGNSSAVVAEIRAQARAGLSTVLVQIPSPHLRPTRPFHGGVVDCLRAGDAELAVEGDTVSARVLVIRQPRIFTRDIPRLPHLEADEIVMIVNQTPRDIVTGSLYYDLDEVRERVEARFGGRVRWVGISPATRDEVLATRPDFPLADTDWHEIIAVDDWRTDRSTPVDVVPVIGRHSRPDPKKWPGTAQEILAAYPATPEVKVRILGGAEPATELIGHTPESWQVLPFGFVDPATFLRSIDFFVYFHDPGLVEAFGRTVLEAMASGAPAILPATFQPLFQDAAIYATPGEVARLVRDLHRDWPRYLKISERARSFVEQRFGPESHIERLRALGVTSGGTETSPAAARGRPALDYGRIGGLDPTARSQRQLAAAAEWIHALESERDRWRELHAAVLVELESMRARTARARGRRMLRGVRHPRAVLRQVVGALRRRSRRLPVAPAKRLVRQRRACAYLAFDVEPSGLRTLARLAAQAALVAGDHYPVIVTGRDEFGDLGEAGVAFEYVPGRSAGQPSGGAADAERLGRLAQVLEVYEPARTVIVSAPHLPNFAELLAIHAARS